MAWFLLHYLPAIAVGTPVLLWLWLHRRQRLVWRVISWVVAGLAAAGGAVCFGERFGNIPDDLWSASRLTPIVAWTRGEPLYPGPNARAALVRMYGPIASLVYLPATLAHAPAAALRIGLIIDLSLLAGAAWLILARDLRGIDRTIDALAVGTFVVIVCANPILLDTAATVTIDAPAISFAIFCCAAATHSKSACRPFLAGLIAGVFAALSIWTKQTMAPIALVLVAGALLQRRRRMALGGCLALAGVSALLLGAFGWRAMMFDMLIVPSRQPMQWPNLTRLAASWRALEMMRRDMSEVAGLLLATAGVAVLALVLRQGQILLRRLMTKSWDDVNEAAGGGVPASTALSIPIITPQALWLFAMALATLPTSATAYAKIGGSGNNSAIPGYFALLATVVTLARLASAAPDANPNPVARIARLTLLVGCGLAGVAGWRGFSLRFKAALDFNRPQSQTIAWELASAHPGELFLPQFPLAALLADGHATHFTQAWFDLDKAGFTIDQPQLNAGLPVHFRALVVKDGPPDALLTRYLPGFTEIEPIAGRPRWFVCTRPGATAPFAKPATSRR